MQHFFGKDFVCVWNKFFEGYFMGAVAEDVGSQYDLPIA